VTCWRTYRTFSAGLAALALNHSRLQSCIAQAPKAHAFELQFARRTFRDVTFRRDINNHYCNAAKSSRMATTQLVWLLRRTDSLSSLVTDFLHVQEMCFDDIPQNSRVHCHFKAQHRLLRSVNKMVYQ
jgi:hypothetical protein